MINSQYILDILHLASEGHTESNLLKKQINFLNLAHRSHTGIGVFIYFASDIKIVEYKLDGNPTEMLEGIEIRNEGLSILADATIHLRNGIIDHLEIFNKCGENYVMTDPENYQIDQTKTDINKRKLIIR